MRRRTSGATRDAFFAMFGPLHFGNFLMLFSILVLVIFRPNVDDPGTYWAIGVVALLIITAAVFIIIGGGGRLLSLLESGREDNRRRQAGLSLLSAKRLSHQKRGRATACKGRPGLPFPFGQRKIGRFERRRNGMS